MANDQTSPQSSFPVFLKISLSVLVSLLLIAAGAFGFWFFQKNFELKRKVSSSPSPSPAAASSPQIEPEDSASMFTPPPVLESPAPQVKSDLELLQEAFASKYSHPVSETEVSISQQTGSYVSGGIHFTGQMGGGWFLAYKQADGTWIIVADGNGTIPCEAIEPYNFPVAMVPECWDDSTSTLITR